jgi:hypothetical protein
MQINNASTRYITIVSTKSPWHIPKIQRFASDDHAQLGHLPAEEAQASPRHQYTGQLVV